MTKTFTQNDIIRYIYKETSPEEKALIESALICEPDLMEEFREFSDLIADLDRVAKIPSDKAVENVLQYSKSLNLHSV